MNALVSNVQSFGCTVCDLFRRAWQKFCLATVKYGEARSASVLRQQWAFLDPATKNEILKYRPDYMKLDT
jgi:hypothetical protein|tara:strand:+ start:221 stop:430 length:210 start_codon:yes stop_codon:yes gene_type:complete